MGAFRLRTLGLGVRVGVSGAVVTILGGLAASGAHVVLHHQNRDDRPGLSVEDVRGVYHGVVAKAPLVTALERGHPEDLSKPDRDALISWLSGPRIIEDYDNLDLGDRAPNEILARSCISCHSRASTDAKARAVPLEFLDDVRKVSVSRDVRPMSMEILVTTTHTHALSLGVVFLAGAALAVMSAWPRKLVGPIVGVTGAALLVDLAGWWVARSVPEVVYALVAAGTLFLAGTSALYVMALAELWRPRSASERGVQ